MSMVIGTNVASLTAQRHLESSRADLNQSMERLASGSRINSAKDDAAGLAIVNRMDSQVSGLTQAVRNANDAISLGQTAEGTLEETTAILQRMRDLSVQSGNATNTTADRTALQSEVASLQEELTRISTTSSFNGQALLDGSFNDKVFQIGHNASDTISLSLTGMGAGDLNKIESADEVPYLSYVAPGDDVPGEPGTPAVPATTTLTFSSKAIAGNNTTATVGDATLSYDFTAGDFQNAGSETTDEAAAAFATAWNGSSNADVAAYSAVASGSDVTFSQKTASAVTLTADVVNSAPSTISAGVSGVVSVTEVKGTGILNVDSKATSSTDTLSATVGNATFTYTADADDVAGSANTLAKSFVVEWNNDNDAEVSKYTASSDNGVITFTQDTASAVAVTVDATVTGAITASAAAGTEGIVGVAAVAANAELAFTTGAAANEKLEVNVGAASLTHDFGPNGALDANASGASLAAAWNNSTDANVMDYTAENNAGVVTFTRDTGTVESNMAAGNTGVTAVAAVKATGTVELNELPASTDDALTIGFGSASMTYTAVATDFDAGSTKADLATQFATTWNASSDTEVAKYTATASAGTLTFSEKTATATSASIIPTVTTGVNAPAVGTVEITTKPTATGESLTVGFGTASMTYSALSTDVDNGSTAAEFADAFAVAWTAAATADSSSEVAKYTATASAGTLTFTENTADPLTDSVTPTVSSTGDIETGTPVSSASGSITTLAPAAGTTGVAGVDAIAATATLTISNAAAANDTIEINVGAASFDYASAQDQANITTTADDVATQWNASSDTEVAKYVASSDGGKVTFTEKMGNVASTMANGVAGYESDVNNINSAGAYDKIEITTAPGSNDFMRVTLTDATTGLVASFDHEPAASADEDASAASLVAAFNNSNDAEVAKYTAAVGGSGSEHEVTFTRNVAEDSTGGVTAGVEVFNTADVTAGMTITGPAATDATNAAHASYDITFGATANENETVNLSLNYAAINTAGTAGMTATNISNTDSDGSTAASYTFDFNDTTNDQETINLSLTNLTSGSTTTESANYTQVGSGSVASVVATGFAAAWNNANTSVAVASGDSVTITAAAVGVNNDGYTADAANTSYEVADISTQSTSYTHTGLGDADTVVAAGFVTQWNADNADSLASANGATVTITNTGTTEAGDAFTANADTYSVSGGSAASNMASAHTGTAVQGSFGAAIKATTVLTVTDNAVADGQMKVTVGDAILTVDFGDNDMADKVATAAAVVSQWNASSDTEVTKYTATAGAAGSEHIVTFEEDTASNAGTLSHAVANGNATAGVLSSSNVDGTTFKGELTVSMETESNGVVASMTPGTDPGVAGVSGTDPIVGGPGRAEQLHKDAVIGSSIKTLDISTNEGASAAITSIDLAIAQVGAQRAELGAFQNRLEHTVNNLQSMVENTSAARSRIQDADFAVESANLAKNQVMQQAGTAMLAQANASGQGVLSLLK